MNKLTFVILYLFIIMACTRNQSKQTEVIKGIPELTVQNEIHNFGTLDAGEIVNYSFKITNGGSGALIIDSVIYSCECLSVNWPEKAIVKGESAFVQVTYDSSGEWGNMYKTLEIYSNASEKKKNIYIAAKVNNQLFNQE